MRQMLDVASCHWSRSLNRPAVLDMEVPKPPPRSPSIHWYAFESTADGCSRTLSRLSPDV